MTERIGVGMAGPAHCIYLEKTNNNTTNLLRQHNDIFGEWTMDNEPPPVKPWSQANKDYLQELVDTGKVDLERTSETKYIDSVRAKNFRDRDEHNFRRNFRNYARSRVLEDTLSGYRRRGGGIILCLFSPSFYLHNY